MRNLCSIRNWFVFVAVALLASCSDDDDGNGGGASGSRFACAQTDGAMCLEYNGAPDPIPAMRDQCTQSGGTVSDSCSRTGVLGICTVASGASSFKYVWYGTDPSEAETPRQICQAMGAGTWTDGG